MALIDRERFKAGIAIVGQMDVIQDQADRHLLVLSKEYLQSAMCRHEMERAIRLDPTFARSIVLPVRRDDCRFPTKISRPNPLYVDLRDDTKSEPWNLLFKECSVELGTTAPLWLKARDDTIRFLERNQSVNLITDKNTKWREFINIIKAEHIRRLSIIDLQKPEASTRDGLLSEILFTLGSRTMVPLPPNDLPVFGRAISALSRSYIALTHFDLVRDRAYYGIDFYAALRYLLMESRELVLLVQSRVPFATLLPPNNLLSAIDIKAVELK